MAQVSFYTVTEDEHGQRLDNYLLSRLKGVPKSAIYKIVRKGEVRVNKGRAKPDRRLTAGDVVRVPPIRVADSKTPPKPSQKLSGTLESAILFDKDGLLVVNKPGGIAVHGGSGISLGLVEALRQMAPYQGFLELVHRLDRETSGCIMMARKRTVLKTLQDQLRQREGIEKTYLALVQGQWPSNQTYVDAPLLRTLLPNNERIVKVHKEGKPSMTRFRVLAKHPLVTLVEAKPISGRTHQIRVHAKHAGCPLVGDEKYGDTSLSMELKTFGVERLFLHAVGLDLEWNDSTFRFRAPLPYSLIKVLQKLQINFDEQAYLSN